MSRSKRDELKRKLAQAHNNADKVLVDLLELQAIFVEHHEKLAQSLETAATTILLSQEIMIAFSQEAWAMDVERLKSYR